MPKAQSEKCRLCAKLSAQEAIARHGPTGTGCWIGDKCHKRRAYYRGRDRYNQGKRQQYRAKTGKEPVVLAIAPPAVACAELLLYREHVDAPLHAIGAELWFGGQMIAHIDTIHAGGLSQTQVKTFANQVLQAFSAQLGVHQQKMGVVLHKFHGQQERSPERCPICTHKFEA